MQAETFHIDEAGAAELAHLVATVRGRGAPGTTLAECRSPTAAFMADIYEVRAPRRCDRRCNATCPDAAIL